MKKTNEVQKYKQWSDKRLTLDQEYTKTEGILMQYAGESHPIGFEPGGEKVIVTAGESLEKYQHGILVLKIRKHGKDRRILVHMDGLLNIIYACYDVTNPFKFSDIKK